MKLTILRADQFKTVQWSGGTTTELFIFPPTAIYSQRDFVFRLSSATVEKSESDFTSLPGFSRKLMILEGTVNLKHEGHHSKTLGKFDIDSFEGEWHTTSVGTCVDFNLITSGTTNGELKGMGLKNEERIEHPLKTNIDWLFIYLNAGLAFIEENERTIQLSKGDLLVIEQPNLAFINGVSKTDSELVFIEIFESNK